MPAAKAGTNEIEVLSRFADRSGVFRYECFYGISASLLPGSYKAGLQPVTAGVYR